MSREEALSNASDQITELILPSVRVLKLALVEGQKIEPLWLQAAVHVLVGTGVLLSHVASTQVDTSLIAGLAGLAGNPDA